MCRLDLVVQVDQWEKRERVMLTFGQLGPVLVDVVAGPHVVRVRAEGDVMAVGEDFAGNGVVRVDAET